MANITPTTPSFVFGYWRPWQENSNAFNSYCDYVKDISLAKYAADTVGTYIANASDEQKNAINQVGQQIGRQLGHGISILSEQLEDGFNEIVYKLDETNAKLSFINQNISILIEHQRMSNILLENIASLLRVPDSEKQRQHHIEIGLKFLANANKDEDLYTDALEELHAAEELMKQDYFVLHRIGMIYLFSKKHIDPKKAIEYFTKAGKYASVESDPKAARLANILTTKQYVENSNIYTDMNALSLLAAESYEKAAFASYVIGDFAAAVNLCEKAKKFLPNAQNKFLLAKYQSRNGQVDDAIINLDSAIDMMPELAIACFSELDLINESKILKLLSHKDTLVRERIGKIIAIVKGDTYKPYDLDYYIELESSNNKDYAARCDAVKVILPHLEFDSNIISLINNLTDKNQYPHLFEEEKHKYIDLLGKLLNVSSIDEKKETFNSIIKNSTMHIGGKYRDGTIFYLDNSGMHGLMCINTNIEASWLDAREYCVKLTKDIFSDWHLPTIEEAKILAKVHIDSISTGFYWSSTPVNDKNIWGTYRFAMVFAYFGGIVHEVPVAGSYKVIAVREF